MSNSQLMTLAHAIPKNTRKSILMNLYEKDLHIYLKELFIRLEPNYLVEITHGVDELGKDLIILKEDKFSTEAIGVVVKVGSIKAGTLGDVDRLKEKVSSVISVKGGRKLSEIRSQIEQALDHPAKLKDLYREIEVNRVYVVLAGEISIQARDRLNAELDKKVIVYDIDWLINKFSSDYPQVFFDGISIDFLFSLIADLEKKHMYSKKGKNLSDYFVEPLISEYEFPLDFDTKTISTILRKKKIPFLQLKSVIQKRRKILIIGEPGCGKSAALGKLAIDAYKEVLDTITRKEQKKVIEIPLLVQAKDLVDIKDSQDLIDHFLGKEEIRGRFTICALFVDSLDEAAPSDRPVIIGNIIKIGAELSCGLIITSRRIDAIDNGLSNFERFELLPFEIGQAIRLVQKIIDNKSLIEAIKDGLHRIEHDIPFFPLSLMLLVDLVEDRKEIPASITELYDRFFDIALGRWDKDKGIEVLFEYIIKKKFLAALAYSKYFNEEKAEITKDEFDEFLRGFSELYGWDTKQLGTFIDEIERAGVLSIKKRVIFKHRSFLDYFVAFHIYDRRDEIPDLANSLIKIYFDQSWTEVAFFYFGLKREIPEDILKRLLDYEKATSLSSLILKYMVGRLIQAGWGTPTKLKKQAIEKGISFAIPVKKEFLSIIGKRPDIPKIVPDILLVGLGELSYGSGFIFCEAKDVLDTLLSQDDAKELTAIIPLLNAIGRFLSEAEINERTERIIEISKRLPPSDEATALLFLLMLRSKDKAISKSIRRRLRYISSKNRKEIRALLPERKNGFR